MAKKKADYLKEAQELGLDVTESNTVVEIRQAIEAAGKNASATSPKISSPKPVAKAGKRSAKAVREAAEEKARLDRAEKVKAGEIEPEGSQRKGPIPLTRPKIDRRSKKYRDMAAKIDSAKEYTAAEAVALALATSTTRFDATVELHVRLNVDPKQADQNIRETVILPNGTGKTLRVAVFAPADQLEKAKEAGADIVGENEILEQLDKGTIDFDVLIAMPQLMSRLGKYAKLLGPKGLMPNPKSGTVTNDVVAAVKAAKAGRVELRVDPQGIIHAGIGKCSFSAAKITENFEAAMGAIKSAQPAHLKLNYIESVTVSTTMGPGIPVTL